MKLFKKNIFALTSIFLLSTFTLYAQNTVDNNSEEKFKPLESEQRIIKVIVPVHDFDLNPHTACYSNEMQVLNGLYEGLFEYNPATLEPQYALCQSYKVSRDKKRWTFTLVKDATFSDGTKINAQVFKESWLALLANKRASFSSMLDCIQGAGDFRTGKGDIKDVRIEARDDYTLTVYLTQPTEHLPKILCHYAFSAVNFENNVYSGAYVLKSFTDDTIELAKNQNYRKADEVYTPGFIFTESADADTNSYSFNEGDADWIISESNIQKIYNQQSVQVQAEFATQYFFFKIQNKPWDDADMRNALLYAVPWEKLRDGYLVKAETFIYPLYGYPAVTPINETDMDYAKELMADARKKLGIPQNEILPLIFAIPDSEYTKQQAILLKDAWEELNVELIIQKTPSTRYVSSIKGWKADLFTYSWIGDFADPIAFLELFRGSSSFNESGFNNEIYDSYLTQAAFAENSTKHYQLLSQAEQLLLDQGMILPISHPVSLNIINLKKVGGWQPNALDLHPLKYLYLQKTDINIPNVI